MSKRLNRLETLRQMKFGKHMFLRLGKSRTKTLTRKRLTCYDLFQSELRTKFIVGKYQDKLFFDPVRLAEQMVERGMKWNTVWLIVKRQS